MIRHLTEGRKQEIIADVLAARANREQFLLEMKERQKEGLDVAKKCANFLKEKYGATKVVLFGSLLNHEKMTPHSDIDLAVWGLPERAGVGDEGGGEEAVADEPAPALAQGPDVVRPPRPLPRQPRDELGRRREPLLHHLRRRLCAKKERRGIRARF